jgi:hypothetical protein
VLSPSLHVSSVQLLQSNSLASNFGQNRYFATHNGIGILTHEIGIFPQSVGNIPHHKNLSAGLKPPSTVLIVLACLLRRAITETRQGGIEMDTLKSIDSSYRSDAVTDESRDAGDAIVVSEWDADVFHHLVSDLERQGYVARRETYRVTPEMNPETGRIVHLHTVELYRVGQDEGEKRHPILDTRQ